MNSSMKRRVVSAGAIVLLAMALAGPAAAISQAAGTAAVKSPATTTYHPGRGAGPLSLNAPASSPGSVIGAVAATIVGAGVFALLILSLDRRSRVRLRSVEGSGLAGGEGPPAQAEDRDRRAA
jgi:hypothetical protein